MSDFVSPHTPAFQQFKRSFDQSVLLAQLFSSAGMDAILAQKAHAESLLQQTASLDFDTFTALSDDARRDLNIQATPEQAAAMETVHETAQPLSDLATTTIPYVLLVFLITIFEAYLQDVVLVIAEHTDVVQAKQGQPIREYIDKTFFRNKQMSEVSQAFNTRLNIPFDTLCSKANTSPHELDKAKVLRNIHIHNAGLVHQDFIKRVAEPGLALNQPYPITIDYLLDIKDKVFLTAMGIDLYAVAMYPMIPHTMIRLA